MTEENGCQCDNLEQFPTIKEESLFFGESHREISIPLCPYCLGLMHGFIEGRCNNLTNEIQDDIRILNQNILAELSNLGSFDISELYKAGYDIGFSVGISIENAKQITTNDQNHGVFNVGANEFGETYHIAGAMLCNENLLVNLKAASVHQIIFFTTIFSQQRLKFKNTVGEVAKGKSTGIICQAFTSEVDKVYQRIFNGFTHALIHSGNGKDFTGKIRNLVKKCLNYISNLGLADKKTNKAIIWIREKNDGSEDRNLHSRALDQILTVIIKQGISQIILLGDLKKQNISILTKALKKRNGLVIYNMIDFHKRIGFRLLMGNHHIAGQLFFLKVLQKQFSVKFAIGMMSGAMDGPAFIGLPTVILTNEGPADRMPMAAKFIKSVACVHYDENYYRSSQCFSANDVKLINGAIEQITQPLEKPGPEVLQQAQYYLDKEKRNSKSIAYYLLVLILGFIVYLLAKQYDWCSNVINRNQKSRSENTGKLEDHTSVSASTYVQTFHAVDLIDSKNKEEDIQEDIFFQPLPEQSSSNFDIMKNETIDEGQLDNSKMEEDFMKKFK